MTRRGRGLVLLLAVSKKALQWFVLHTTHVEGFGVLTHPRLLSSAGPHRLTYASSM